MTDEEFDSEIADASEVKSDTTNIHQIKIPKCAPSNLISQMGIQRFGSRMRDHATRTTLGTTDSPADHGVAIIDGPGLAHYIYYGLCGSSSSSVTYGDCANATIAWLDKLRGFGFSM